MFTDNRGYTFAEVLIASVLTAIIIPILAVVFMGANKSFTGYEAINSLKKMNQETVNRMYLRLGRSKRLFENSTDNLTYLNKLNMTGMPAAMSDSKLPTIEETGTLAEGTTDFHPASFGNSLLLAYNDKTIQLDGIKETATSTTTVSVRIDSYKFAYYYLTEQDSPKILGKQTYKATEWQSIPYAECNQIINISSATKKSNVIIALVDKGINYCWDSSKSSSTVAFSSFTISGTTGSLTTATGHTIINEKYQILTKAITGIMRGGYQYGMSPNQSDWGSSTKVVPRFATASGNFPGGLEIGIVGASAARQVLVRSVMVAHGNSMATTGSELMVVVSSRDIW